MTKIYAWPSNLYDFHQLWSLCCLEAVSGFFGCHTICYNHICPLGSLPWCNFSLHSFASTHTMPMMIPELSNSSNALLRGFFFPGFAPSRLFTTMSGSGGVFLSNLRTRSFTDITLSSLVFVSVPRCLPLQCRTWDVCTINATPMTHNTCRGQIPVLLSCWC